MKYFIVLFFSLSAFSSEIPRAKLDRLFSLLGTEKRWEGIITASVKRDMVNTPQLKLIEKEWVAHFRKFKNWHVSKDGLYNFYRKHFTENDVNELIKIYENPVLRKMNKLSPLLRLEIKKVFRNQTKEEKNNMKQILKALEKKIESQKKAKVKKK